MSDPDWEIEAQAARFAEQAHRGQVDKSGFPYIAHPCRVAQSRRLLTPEQRAVAWLHDVIEDTDAEADDLRAAGFPEQIVTSVLALTHLPGEPRDDYYARVNADATANVVKLADIDENLSPERLGRLDAATARRLVEKYAHARRVLGEAA